MNNLVEKLTTAQQIQANKPDLSGKGLKERIDLGYVHILFKETDTELCIKLNKEHCHIDSADFENNTGTVHLEGGITLNYETVKCIADINLANMQGQGRLVSLNEKEYQTLMQSQY